MQAAIIRNKLQLAIESVPLPKIGPEELLVQVKACGVCATDVHIYHGEVFPNYPLTPGHEFAGTVAEVGSDVDGFAPGDRVAVDPSVFCEACYFCNRNQQNHCESWNGLGTTRPGGFAEYVAVPAKNAFKFDKISFAEAAMAEPLACVVYGQQRAPLPLGADVLIFGAGPIGALHLLTARRNGAAAVVSCDLRQDKLDLMRTLGATETLIADAALPERLRKLAPFGFDLVIDATGVASVVQQAPQYVKNGGTFLLFGVCAPGERVAFSPFDIYRRDISIIGSFAIRKTFGAALALLESGAVQVKPLIRETFPLAELKTALELVDQGKAKMKVQIAPGGRA